LSRLGFVSALAASPSLHELQLTLGRVGELVAGRKLA